MKVKFIEQKMTLRPSMTQLSGHNPPFETTARLQQEVAVKQTLQTR
jgi:hypothetical protein